ncbi:hypothetical protein FVER14953_20252 [Fusarium verticillioides]|nr:hypothetical protein FVER14953_20252 [Fusarium verticillioides]
MLSSELGAAVEQQIETQQGPSPWQPDSVTNITETMSTTSLGEVENDEVLGIGDGWSDDSASLVHINEDEFSDESEDSDNDSDGGVGLDA